MAALPSGFPVASLQALLRLWLCFVAACSSHSASPLRPQSRPRQAAERSSVLGRFGQGVYRGLAAGGLTELVADDLEVHQLLQPSQATRVAALRHIRPMPTTLPKRARQLLSAAAYGGACVQGLSVEGPGGGLGLVGSAWTFDRMLIWGERSGRERIGLWLEGTFVHTQRGVVILLLDRIEEPRIAHADLELAQCDLRI